MDLQKISNTMVVNETKELKKQIDVLHNDIVVSVPLAVLPSAIFEEYFLDFFRSGGNADPTASLALKWIELSGGVYNEVIITDDQGNPIFNTPGMYAKPDVNNTGNFADMASTYNLKANRIHSEGVNYLANELNGMESDIVTNIEIYLNRWNAIFNYYDKGVVKTNSVAKQLLDNTNDFLDYD